MYSNNININLPDPSQSRVSYLHQFEAEFLLEFEFQTSVYLLTTTGLAFLLKNLHTEECVPVGCTLPAG